MSGTYIGKKNDNLNDNTIIVIMIVVASDTIEVYLST